MAKLVLAEIQNNDSVTTFSPPVLAKKAGATSKAKAKKAKTNSALAFYMDHSREVLKVYPLQ